MTYSTDINATITTQQITTKGVALRTQGSNKNESSKQANQRKAFIFRKAWALAAMKALRFGGLKCTYFATCLKVAYRQCAVDCEQQLSRYKALMLENKKYLTQLKNQLSHYENNNHLLNQKEVITNLLPRIKQAEIRQSYYVDLLLG
ncbi:hypothetical protein VXS05_17535 [Photobacterium toruni]|uniref:hypothetical protein n=1 Tax=Photobacterium toruni TaxID=1935446 RepID=UPI002E19235C|nr:hypothetical protein [Photobacterium toruni]